MQEKVKLVNYLRNSMHNLNSSEAHIKQKRKNGFKKKKDKKNIFFFGGRLGLSDFASEISSQRLRNSFQFRMFQIFLHVCQMIKLYLKITLLGVTRAHSNFGLCFLGCVLYVFRDTNSMYTLSTKSAP